MGGVRPGGIGRTLSRSSGPPRPSSSLWSSLPSTCSGSEWVGGWVGGWTDGKEDGGGLFCAGFVFFFWVGERKRKRKGGKDFEREEKKCVVLCE